MARLTIPDEQTFAEFTVVTSTSAFPISFSLFAKADLTVLVDNVEQDQSSFTFAGDLLDGGGYDGGTVTLNTAVDDVTVRIERNVAPVRTSNFAPASTTPMQSVDQALNRLTAGVQDLERKKLTTPAGSSAGKYLGFNASGEPALLSGTGADSALRTDLAGTGGAGLIKIVQSGVSPTAEPLESAVRKLGVRVEQFGVVGASTAGAAVDYAAAIQRAIDAAVDLKVPLIFAPGLFYRSDTALTHSGPLTIIGYGATLYTAAAITLLVPGSDLTIDGLAFQGPYTAYAANSYGIKGGGSANGAGVAPTRKSKMRFNDVTLRNFGSGGAWIEYAEDVIWTRPVVKECGWHGIIHMNTNDSQVLAPNVDTIYGNPGSGYNAYGIGFGASQPTNDTVRYPPCARGLVDGGTVRNIPDWHGLDTHGGADIRFSGTTLIDCRRGAIITYSDYSAPVRCVIENVRSINTYPLEAVSANGGEKRAEGFWLTGSTSLPAVDCALVNCYAFGHGMAFANYGSSTAYGIYVGPSTRARVQNCSAVNCLAGGLYIGADAVDFLIDSALIDNPYTTTHSAGGSPAVTTSAPRYVEIGVTGSGAATGLIVGTRMLKTDAGTGTNVGYFGFRIGDGSAVDIRAVDTLFDGPVERVSNTGTAVRFKTDEGSKTHDFGSLADGAGETTTVTVTGAALGNFAEASLSVDLQGMTLTAWVSATDTVSVRLQNETGAPIDLASATLRARVRKGAL
jgi:hypothetical protein